MEIKRIACLLIAILSFMPQITLADEKLVFSLDLIRHGDRTPLFQIPTAPLPWKEGLGQLTKEGVEQGIRLGEKLRKKYVSQYHLLPEMYDAKSMYVRSTNFPRAIKWADAVLLGLYPLKARGENQDIPVNAFTREEDNLLVVKPSKNIFFIMKRYLSKRNLWKEKTIHLQNKLTYWRNVTGMELNGFSDLGRLADNLYVRRQHHLALPNGITSKDADDIIALSELAIITNFKLKGVTSPMGREFIKTVADYFEQIMQNKTTIKYVLLSGHDGSIMSVMNTLQSPLEKTPKYGACLNFSLYKNEGQYYVKVSYNDKPVFIPACNGNVCSLSQFAKL